MKTHPADIYRRTRAHLFATYRKKGYRGAKNLLDKKYAKMFSRNCYLGLKAELYFYHTKKNCYDLVPALDCGDATDFSGIIDGHHARIDVTTNPKFKKLNNYEKYAHSGKPYYISICDLEKQESILVDINFPFCEQCDGRLFPMIVFQDPWSLNLPKSKTYFNLELELWHVCSKFPDKHHINVTNSKVIDSGVFTNVPNDVKVIIAKDNPQRKRKFNRKDFNIYNIISTYLRKDFASPITIVTKRYWYKNGEFHWLKTADVSVLWAQYITLDFINRGKSIYCPKQ